MCTRRRAEEEGEEPDEPEEEEEDEDRDIVLPTMAMATWCKLVGNVTGVSAVLGGKQNV
jgi:hypothetical protein